MTTRPTQHQLAVIAASLPECPHCSEARDLSKRMDLAYQIWVKSGEFLNRKLEANSDSQSTEGSKAKRIRVSEFEHSLLHNTPYLPKKACRSRTIKALRPFYETQVSNTISKRMFDALDSDHEILLHRATPDQVIDRIASGMKISNRAIEQVRGLIHTDIEEYGQVYSDPIKFITAIVNTILYIKPSLRKEYVDGFRSELKRGGGVPTVQAQELRMLYREFSGRAPEAMQSY